PRRPYVFTTCTPSNSLGTTRALTPDLGGFRGSVTANTKRKSATPPFVMKRFSPLRTKSCPRRSAWVLIEDASDPAHGSVSARAPTLYPATTGLRTLRLCCI